MHGLYRQNDGAKFKVKTVHGPQNVIVIRERFIKFIVRIGGIIYTASLCFKFNAHQHAHDGPQNSILEDAVECKYSDDRWKSMIYCRKSHHWSQKISNIYLRRRYQWDEDDFNIFWCLHTNNDTSTIALR